VCVSRAERQLQHFKSRLKAGKSSSAPTLPYDDHNGDDDDINNYSQACLPACLLAAKDIHLLPAKN